MESLKYYIKLIKAQLFYLLNKKNITVIIILNTFLLLYTLYCSSIFDGMSKLDANRNYYLNSYIQNYFMIFRIIYISFIIFINVGFSQKEYESYKEFIVKNNKTKADFYITKCSSLLLFYLIQLFLSYSIFMIFLVILPYGKMYLLFTKPFLNMYMIGIIYSLISSIFYLIFKTYQAVMLPLIFYLFSFIFCSFYTANDNLKNIISLILPYGDGELLKIDFGIHYIVLYLIILSLINSILIYKKDGI